MKHILKLKNHERWNEVVRSDGVVVWNVDDEGFVGWRLVVCHVSLTWSDGVWTGIDVGNGGLMLEVPLVGGGD
jgi:hypothetical protein